nr:hypothetical protein GCM10020092_102600 [Actinoplanes digitatis]
MRLGERRGRIRAVAVGQLGPQPLEQVEGLGAATLRREQPHEQRGGQLVRWRVRGEPAQIGLAVRTGTGPGQRGLGPQRGDVCEEPRALGQVGNLREPGTGRVGGRARGLGVAGPQRRTRPLDQAADGHRVDVHPVGGDPVATGNRLHRETQPPDPGHQGL